MDEWTHAERGEASEPSLDKAKHRWLSYPTQCQAVMKDDDETRHRTSTRHYPRGTPRWEPCRKPRPCETLHLVRDEKLVLRGCRAVHGRIRMTPQKCMKMIVTFISQNGNACYAWRAFHGTEPARRPLRTVESREGDQEGRSESGRPRRTETKVAIAPAGAGVPAAAGSCKSAAGMLERTDIRRSKEGDPTK